MMTWFRRNGRLYEIPHGSGAANADPVTSGLGFDPTRPGRNPFSPANGDTWLAGFSPVQSGQVLGPAPGLERNPFLYSPGAMSEVRVPTPEVAPAPFVQSPAALSIDDPWAGSYATNPKRLELAAIGGASTVTGSGGPSTAMPGLLPLAEQLAANLDLTGSPSLAAALASGVNLDANPKGDLRQFDATNRGAPIAIEEAAGSPADAAVQQARQGRRQGRRGRAVADVATGAANAIGYLPADLGAGKWIASKSAQLAGKIPVTNAATHTAAQALGVGGKFLGAGVGALPWVAAAAPAVMGAIEGSQSGSGGAAIQGGTAAAGTLIGGAIGSALAPGLGTVIGAGIGGMLGNAAGGMGRAGAVSAVEAAQGGDTGLAGQIGRSLDGVIDTPMEVESRQMVAQMNSPAVLALKAEERQRNAAERARMAQDLLMQAYARGIG